MSCRGLGSNLYRLDQGMEHSEVFPDFQDPGNWKWWWIVAPNLLRIDTHIPLVQHQSAHRGNK
jgi:hypothetical protein